MTARRVQRVPATRSGLLPPELFRQPVQAQLLERFGPRFAGLAVEADLGVPGVEHLLPLIANGLPLRRTVDGCRPVPCRWVLHRAGVPAAERGRAVDDGGALAEAQRLVHRESPAGRRRERATDVLEAGPRGE